MSERIAIPYAAAAFAFAKEAGTIKQWGTMFHTLANSEDAVSQVARNFPGGEEAIADALAELLGISGGAQHNFLRVVGQNRRMSALGSIARLFADMQIEDEGAAVMRIESALPLADGEKKSLEKTLASWCGKKVRASYSENPDLLAGIRVHLKDNVLDASVRGRLDRLGASLGG